jgi:hypothetical protein
LNKIFTEIFFKNVSALRIGEIGGIFCDVFNETLVVDCPGFEFPQEEEGFVFVKTYRPGLGPSQHPI